MSTLKLYATAIVLLVWACLVALGGGTVAGNIVGLVATAVAVIVSERERSRRRHAR